jgi:glycine/D-amino acid oxidase-like deaminating enzyme
MKFPISEESSITYPGPQPKQADVVIIGGGVIGVCTALFLARAGQKVVLCEKGRIAGEQSSRNWGWIRQQGRDPDELPIMMEANRHWNDLARETNVDVGLRQNGITYLAKTPAELEAYEAWLKSVDGSGVASRMLSRKETAAKLPHLSRSYAGALHTDTDMRAEPWVAVPALAGIAVRDGAQIIENCAVRTLETEAGAVTGVVTEHGRIRAAQVLVSGGAWSSLFLRAHGVHIPQLSVRLSAGATEPLPDIGFEGSADDEIAFRRRDDGGYTLAAGGFHELFVGPDAVRNLPKYLTQLKADPFGTRFLAGAPRGYPDSWLTRRKWRSDDVTPFEKIRVLNPTPNMKKLRRVAETFRERFPHLPPVKYRAAWGGMADTMPDIVPIVDRVERVPGLFVAAGMSGHGFGIGPGMGRLIADLVLGRDVGFDLSRFRMSRFTDGSKMVLGPSI